MGKMTNTHLLETLSNLGTEQKDHLTTAKGFMLDHN
jgi:hypothetical protein